MKSEFFMQKARGGYALLMVMGVTAVAMITLAATLGRTLTNAKMNNRSNEYSVTGNAAEAAVEKVVTRMGYDFQNYGLGAVYGNLSLYQNSTPTKILTGTTSRSRMAMATRIKPTSPRSRPTMRGRCHRSILA